MSPRPTPPGQGGRRRRAAGASHTAVVNLDAHRIRCALDGRSRYQYVTPRVEREGMGWKVVSPNCSRNILRDGGEVAIAWFEPLTDGRWQLHAHDHARGCWVLKATGLTLAQALAIVCDDPERAYWQ